VNQAANLIGVLFGVAIIAVLAAKPQVVSSFFSGISGVTRAAVSPVTGH
jgi:Ca2+/Na+ antiporter